jgi:hypothetical protein
MEENKKLRAQWMADLLILYLRSSVVNIPMSIHILKRAAG